MSEGKKLQHDKEEAEFLRKRSWDLIELLDKMESQLNTSDDKDERHSLQIRISNTRRLLEDYESEYKIVCSEASIPSEIIGTGESDDAASSTISNIKSDQQIDMPPLFLVPARNRNFLGRDDDVKKFVQLVLDGGAFAICVVKGMGGIGKTEMAREVCHIFHETWQEHPDLPEYLTDLWGQKKGGFFRDGILWIPFHPEGQTPRTLTDDLISQLIKKHPEINGKITKMTLDELADALTGKNILVVLDNVEQNLRTLDYVLERFKGRFHLLITSRIAIPGIKSINIDVLNDKDAENLFLRYMGNQHVTEEEQKTVRELCKLLGNYPLLIKIIASQVKVDNSSLAELLKKYQENPAQMLDECNDSLCIDQRHVNVRSCFMMSFKMLNDKQQDVLLHAALFNNPFTMETLSALLDDMDKDNMLHIVEQIESLSLINRLDGKDGLTTYELHPLMRELALDLLMKPVKRIPSATKVKNETLLKELQQAQEEKNLSEQLKNDRSLVKKAIEAGQYFNQVFDFDLVLNLMQVLDGKLDSIISLDKRLLLNKLAIRAAVALQQEENEIKYRKLRADMEKQNAKKTFKFVGREEELKDFENEFLFRSGSFILNIHTDGQGGVGKTQLLQQMLKICRSKYANKMISCDELIDFYYTEARSKAGVIDQIIRKLGVDYFPNVAEQLEKYYQTKDRSEQQYILDDAVDSLHKNYEVFAALWDRSGKIIILFFDTYEVIQFVDKDKNIAERSDFSEWLEKELFPALQSDNTRLVIAGRYPLIDAAKESAVATKRLSLFKYKEAVAFLTERLKKVAEFSKEEYQLFLSDFPQADRLLQPFRDNLATEQIRVRIYEFPNGHRKELGEEVWLALKNNVPSKGKKELLEELKLTEKELDTVIKLAGKRPIYLALFMYWVHFSNGEPSKLVKNAQNIGEEVAKKEFFENTILEWLWNNADKRKYLYYMTVAYRRITADIMQHLTGDSFEKCEKILMEDISHLSFVKYKEDKQNGNIIILHDEMRELIVNRWAHKIDPEYGEKKEILKKLIRYYKKTILSKKYYLRDISCRRFEEFNIPKHIFDRIKNIDSLYHTEEKFVANLQKKCGLTQEELDSYLSAIFEAAAQEVSQEKREVYTPELQEYAFIANADSGAQFFCDEFDIAMDDGRYTYAGLLGREAVACRKKYGASKFYELQIELRDVQHYIDSSKPNIKKALDIIKKVNERQHHDKTWKKSLLYGQFTLWEGIAEFWQDNFDKAIELMRKASRIFINYDKQEELIYLADNWTGYTYYRKADFVQAEYWMKISLEGLIEFLSKELDDNKRRRKLQQSIQYSLGNIAMLYRYTGKFIEAARYAETAHAIVKSLPRNKKEILRSLNTLSHVLAIAGHNMDARQHLDEAEGIYKEIPDRLLGGRLYSTFCQLSYGTMEFANLLECYRAEDLHRAVENSHGSHVGEYIKYAEKSIQLLEQEPVFHKELADAYFSVGELYMMMPANHPAVQDKGDKWELAEKSFEKALEFANKSQFQYRVVDTLASLVTLYYFQSQTEGISLEQKKECADKQKHYQDEIESDWKIKQYPNLAGRYELIQGDIHFDKALEKLKVEYLKADEGVHDLLKAFNHYIRSAVCKKKFNKNRYYLMLRIIYNRLDKLVELAHPLSFPRLEFLDHEQEEKTRKKSLISLNILRSLENKWKNNEDDFSRMFNYAHLLGKKKISEDELEKLENELKEHKKAGAYWQAVLVNKCLIELHWTQAHLSEDIEEKEKHLENVVLHLNRHSRQYRLMGDSFHAKRSYERAEKITAKKIISNLRLKKGLDGYTEIVKGEYFLQRVEFANLLESLVAGELEYGRRKFEEQFLYTEEKTKEKVSYLEKSRECFKNGIMLLEEALNDVFWRNQSLSKQEYENKLSEAYFMTGDIFVLLEQYADALDFFEKCMKICTENEDDCRLDDAKQSCLSVFYFSSGKCGSKERCQEYEQELEEKIQAKDYSRPWVAARFRITQGDVLFSECYEIDRLVNYDSSYKFKKKKEKIEIERKDLLQMFQKYIEACNYKAGYNELSFEAGLRVLRRRIEMIPDPGSLDTLYEIFRQLWQDGEHLQKKKEELDSILQLIRLRKLIL